MELSADKQPVITPHIPRDSRHHKGLYVLFFTEMWERFGYYLMIGIFFLYLVDPAANGGKGFDTGQCSQIKCYGLELANKHNASHCRQCRTNGKGHGNRAVYVDTH